MICWWMCKMFFNMGFYRVTIKGIRATEREAPILALAPHSSFSDAFPVVLLTAPSLVVKQEVQEVPFFASEWSISFRKPIVSFILTFQFLLFIDLIIFYYLFTFCFGPWFLSIVSLVTAWLRYHLSARVLFHFIIFILVLLTLVSTPNTQEKVLLSLGWNSDHVVVDRRLL